MTTPWTWESSEAPRLRSMDALRRSIHWKLTCPSSPSPYVRSPQSTKSGAAGSSGLIYDLYGVINHFGGSNFGCVHPRPQRYRLRVLRGRKFIFCATIVCTLTWAILAGGLVQPSSIARRNTWANHPINYVDRLRSCPVFKTYTLNPNNYVDRLRSCHVLFPAGTTQHTLSPRVTTSGTCTTIPTYPAQRRKTCAPPPLTSCSTEGATRPRRADLLQQLM
jgi:hypothetical protein